MLRMKIRNFLWILTLVLSTQSWAGIYDTLNETQKSTLQKGGQVFVAEDVGQAWPKVTVYQRIEASPEEAMAVMMDCDRHSSFFKDILKSKVSKKPDPSTLIVDYTMHLPWPLANENYTLKDQISLINQRSTYLLSWTMLRADSTQDIQGSAHFEALGTGALLAYQNLVVPNTSFAQLVKGQAIQAVKDAANALVKQILLEKTKNPTLLENQVAELRHALEN